MHRKLLHRGVVCLMCLMPALPAGASDAEKFIDRLADTALATLGSKDISEEERNRWFHELFTKRFELERFSRFVLGRYWRRATTAERDQFMLLFEKFTAQAYADRFGDIGNAKLTVSGSRVVSAGETLVSSTVEFAGRDPIEVGWRVRRHQGEFKIVDVVIEGVSMRIALRDEFAAVIRRNKGKVAGLLAALRKKTESRP